MAMYMGKKSNGVRRSHVQQGMEGSMAKQNLGMASNTPPLNKAHAETRGSAITYPHSRPLP